MGCYWWRTNTFQIPVDVGSLSLTSTKSRILLASMVLDMYIPMHECNDFLRYVHIYNMNVDRCNAYRRQYGIVHWISIMWLSLESKAPPFPPFFFGTWVMEHWRVFSSQDDLVWNFPEGVVNQQKPWDTTTPLDVCTTAHVVFQKRKRPPVFTLGTRWKLGVLKGWNQMCDRVDQLPWHFHIMRGWETQPKSVGVYRAPWNKDSRH